MLNWKAKPRKSDPLLNSPIHLHCSRSLPGTKVQRKQDQNHSLCLNMLPKDLSRQEPLEILSKTLAHFLSCHQENDLPLKMPLYPEYKSFPGSFECRWTHDPESGILTVRAVAKPLHDSVSMYMSYSLRDLTEVLTPEENLSIACPHQAS